MSVQDPQDSTEKGAVQPEQLSSLLGKLSRTTIVLWLVAISSLFLLLPLYLGTAAVRDNISHLNAEFESVQQQLVDLDVPDPDLQPLRDELAAMQVSLNEVEQARLALVANHVDWAAVMDAIGDYNPAALSLTNISQAGSQLTLTGRALDDNVVTEYVRRLDGSSLFPQVTLQSIRAVATPFVTPAPVTHTPTDVDTTPTSTPTPTPPLEDQYETDDFTPVPIFFAQPQQHNFYPIYDVDRVMFLAKAGRWYRVYTAALSPGVDTFLYVTVGGEVYSNDDREPRDLSSEVVFQITGESDQDVSARVSNRGFYGPDKWYQIIVEEILPEPSPTPTSTPQPTPTHTPATPSTGTPSPSPTAAPPVVSSIAPDVASSGDQSVQVTIVGEGFYGTPQVFLSGVGADIPASDVSVTAGWRINCTFDLSGRPAGVWDVLVVNPDDQVGVQSDAFTILGPATATPTPTRTPTLMPTLTPSATVTTTSSSLVRPPGVANLPAVDAIEFVIVLELAGDVE